MISIMAKRIFDLFWATLGVLLLSPLLLLISIWIKLDSPGSVFFKQARIGRYGEEFKIIKFRTMVTDAEKHGLKVTVGSDPRITNCGRFLRKYKLDELPQLFNVIAGEMSLVGPRPEVREYVECYPEKLRTKVLSVRPGITDLAAIEYLDENQLLANSKDPEKTYIEEIMPIKLDYYSIYIEKQNLWLDFCLILKTFLAIIR
jgi:lipopolysaccharide/colanic/teichoic acid biosynthesis glycosyltransferase